MSRINYSKETERVISENAEKGIKPSLLLHSCCAPCSSYVLEYLSPFFKITVLYYNPNIFPETEYIHRINEEKRFIKEFTENTNPKPDISFAEIGWESEKFYEAVKGYENIREGGERCFRCFHLRLSAAVSYAEKNNFDYVTTTLSISPLKNAEKLNEICRELTENTKVKALPSDFKKKGGYLRSCELSREYGLYRQDYCGCVFSKKERDERLRQKNEKKN